jgi:uncharacterized cupredoxin-like copper-binding protein
MRLSRVLVAGAAITVSVGVLAGCSSGDSDKDTTKKQDSGVTASTQAKGTPVAVVVSDTQGVNGPMTMTATPSSVAAGPVTFTVKNSGTIKHEMVVVKTNGATLTPGSDGKVSEKGSVGEIGDIPAGATRSVTLDLQAGQYELICNIKDHYKMGMYTAFTVT